MSVVHAPKYICQDRAFAPVDGHQAVLGEEDVQLHEARAVGKGTVDNEEGEVVELVDLGPLPEVLRVLDRQGVEPEGVAQQP